MKKVTAPDAKRKSTPMSKAQHNDKASLLRKLQEAAQAARTRVSSYSDDRRSHLEQLARGVMNGASTEQVCRH